MMKRFYQSLSEKDRRRYAAMEAIKLGHGGINYIAELLGCCRDTISKAIRELKELPLDCGYDPRIRQPGGGRKPYVMPAFVIAAIMALRRHPIGLMGLPALFIMGAGILSPLALAEAIKPSRYGVPSDMGGFWLYFVLSVVFIAFAVVCLKDFRFRSTRPAALKTNGSA